MIYLQEVERPFKIFDPKNGYSCSKTSITKENESEVARIKRYIVESFNKYGYHGFSHEIDNQFDPYSVYFCVTDRTNKIITASRVTTRTVDNIIPFEMGLKQDGTKYVYKNDRKAGDMNSFAFSSAKALPLLYAYVGHYALRHGLEKGFCLLDDDSQRYRKLYLNTGWAYSSEYNERIFFPGFGKMQNGGIKPTAWSVLEIDHKAIIEHSKLIECFQRIDL